MEPYGDIDNGGAPAVPRRARSQSRVGLGQDSWAAAEEAHYAYGARGRSPGRSATGVDLMQGHPVVMMPPPNRGSLLVHQEQQEQHFADDALYYDGVEPPYTAGGDGRRGHAQQHDMQAPSWRGPTSGAPPQAARSALGRGALPPGYGMAQPQNGWPDDGAAKQMFGGSPGGWGEAPPDPRSAGLHRRGGYADHEAGNPEQWRQIQATLHKQDASKAAAELAAHKQAMGPRAGALKRWASYSMRRTWYLIDSKIGTLKYQVLMLIGVAVVISVSGGKIVQVVRDMAVEEGLLDNYTTYSDGVWLAWSLIIDPGYGTWPDLVVGVRMRAVTVIIVIIGILYLSVIIALIVDAVQVKMEDLKKARV
jgi:hypothetical protein